MDTMKEKESLLAFEKLAKDFEKLPETDQQWLLNYCRGYVDKAKIDKSLCQLVG